MVRPVSPVPMDRAVTKANLGREALRGEMVDEGEQDLQEAMEQMDRRVRQAHLVPEVTMHRLMVLEALLAHQAHPA